MPLKDKQKQNIQKMSVNDTIEVLYECIERLGIVSQKEYVDITGYSFSRENLVQDMIKGKIKHVVIGKIRFPIVNDK